MCQCTFIDDNKCIIWWQMLIVMECVCVCCVHMCMCIVSVRGYRKTHFALFQSFCELKTSLIKSNKSEKKLSGHLVDRPGVIIISTWGDMRAQNHTAKRWYS